MSYDVLGAAALNYAPCQYNNSRVSFRGPERRLDVPYVAFLGGTETYGKFINAPFPSLVESDIGVNCINFGIANAGIDVFLEESFLVEAARNAKATVLQIVGAQNLSNRFYTVHPRRNDRFLKASPLLNSIYPEIDFSEFNFNRHMLSTLYETSPDRFTAVRREVQQAWVSRMKVLCRRLQGDVILLWFADHLPPDGLQMQIDPAHDSEPLFVTRKMVEDLHAHVDNYVEVSASADALDRGTSGMIFSELEALAAAKLMGPNAHGEVAIALGRELHKRV